jgi:LmbE family N-acetylglucosaminyl deacetylase
MRRMLLPARRLDATQPAAADWLRRRFGPAVLVLSPHSDDAAYSIAGAMRALAGAGIAVRVLTPFGRSAFAPNRPELDADAVTALRHGEDAAAMVAIDPRITVSWWDIPDVALRQGLAVEQVVSKRPFDADARHLIDELAAAIDSERRRDESVLAPLGMGWHIDHRIVAEAGARLARDGAAVHFYEDLPYAGFTRSSRLWLAQAWRRRVVGLPLRAADVRAPDLPELKRRVFDAYASQASDAFWRGIARQTARRGCAERLWLGRKRV